MKRAYYKRTFLNSDESGGIALIEATVDEVSKEYGSFEAVLKIGDCSRVVDLQFGVWSVADAENSRLKLRRLESTIRAFTAAVNAQIDIAERSGKLS